MIIRAKTFRSWMEANFTKQDLRDMSHNGVDTGWYGLTYYSQTCKLYERFKREIWNLLAEDAENQGLTALEFINHFHRSKDVSTDFLFENLMAWYGAERIAMELTEGGE